MAPGFKKFVIKPAVVGDLTWVKAHHDSPYGRIASAWERSGKRLMLDVTIPPNTMATIHVPTRDPGRLREGGKSAMKVRGLKFLGTEQGAAIFEAGSGRYRFSSAFPAH